MSLQILLSLPPPAKQQSLTNLYRQTAHGVNELVHRHAPTLTTSEQWEVLLAVLEFAGVGRLAKKPDNSRKSSWAQTGLGTLMSVCNSFDSLGGQIFAPHEPQVKNTEITRFYCRRFTLDRAYFPLRKSVEMIVINQTCIVLVLYMVLVVEYKVDENIVVECMVLVVEYKVGENRVHGFSCRVQGRQI